MNKKWISFLKYTACSLTTTAFDLILFYLFHNQLDYYHIEASIFIATILSRLISSIVQYFMIKKLVFKPDNKSVKRIFKHFLLECSKVLLSASILTFVDSIIKGNALIEKCFVDTFLFIMFYFAQKLWVFKGESEF